MTHKETVAAAGPGTRCDARSLLAAARRPDPDGDVRPNKAPRRGSGDAEREEEGRQER